MAALIFTYCNHCGNQDDCLLHEDVYLCVDGDDDTRGIGCHHKITAAQDAARKNSSLDYTCQTCKDTHVVGCGYVLDPIRKCPACGV